MGVKMSVCLIFLLFSSYASAVNNDIKFQPIEKAKECIHLNTPSEAVKILSEYQPSVQELPLYHYTYAKAYELLKKQNDFIAHLRLAYLYSQNGEMKERFLLERAEAYNKIGYHSEAVLTFKVFLKNFPHSQYSEKAYLGLADSLYQLAFFSEAKKAYEKAGNSSKALYGKANTLHSMGKIREAHEVYIAMLDKDRGYIESSQETVYNIGENLRLMGEFSAARIYLSSITAQPWKCKACRSLGLIEMEEKHFDIAVKFFRSALQSHERQLNSQVLLNLADVYVKQGRQEDAKTTLLQIRNQYPYSKEYDEALLMLSQLYNKEGNHNAAIPLIKELVFRQSPNQKALDEFEAIILEAEEKDREEFLGLWKTIGCWLLQPPRSQSLLRIARGLKGSGKPYLEVCTWLSKYGSGDAQIESNLLLSNFYADIGDAATAMKYFLRIGITNSSDEILRVRAKIHLANKEYLKAAKVILGIAKLHQDDLVFLADLLESVRNDRKIMEFFERAVNKSDVPPWVYVKLADALYEMGEKSDALKYYKAAVSQYKQSPEVKSDDLVWALYRISVLSSVDDSKDALKNIQKSDDVIGRFSGLLLKEFTVSQKIKGMF
jgi:tetratricopeptide (TPR) repeat protein